MHRLGALLARQLREAGGQILRLVGDELDPPVYVEAPDPAREVVSQPSIAVEDGEEVAIHQKQLPSLNTVAPLPSIDG
jgi:hypothetical protein